MAGIGRIRTWRPGARSKCRLLEEAESDVAAGNRGIGVKALRKRLGR
jgi:hypothetical protein